MRTIFWRYAHRHYHAKRLTRLGELAAFTWGAFFSLVYAFAFLAGWRPDIVEAVVGTVFVGAPLSFGLLHRRIRLEAAKAPDALYRKQLAPIARTARRAR